MEVTCPACAARYTADDDKFRGKTARMRCRACETVWLVSGPSDASDRERRAAVARRDAERERRDLFASRPAEHGYGSVRETLRPPPTGIAARNENSVLFKVDNLFGGSRPATSAAATAALRPAPMPFMSDAKQQSDDSGIIDLKALAALAPPVARPPVANLFGASEPPPSAFAREVSASSSFHPQKAAGAPLLGGLGKYAGMAAAVAVFALCGIGVAIAFAGDDLPPKITAAVVSPPAAPAPTALVEPAAPAAGPSATSSETTASTPSATKSTRRGAKGSAARKGKSGVITSKMPPPAPKAVKPADPCHCRGDFNCVIACAAGRMP